MSATTTDQNLNVDVAMLAYLAEQPRAVRMLTPDLDVMWNNTPDREERLPLYRDRAGQSVAIPPPGPGRLAWPVFRALRTGEPAQRNYWVRMNAEDQACYRVRAWIVGSGNNGARRVVEEVERIDSALCHDGRLKRLDEELTGLIQRVAEFLTREAPPQALRLRLPNANLQPCQEIRQCEREECPAHDNEENLRCWEMEYTLCRDGMETQTRLEKFNHCSKCDTYQMACPDPLTRVGENFNRLLSLLEMKYQEAMDAQQQVQQADKMAVIGELMLGLAHEIKTPLSVIMGRLDCLGLELESLGTAEIAEDLTVMRGHAGRMRGILDEVLTLARPEPPRPRPEEIGSLLEEVLAMVGKTLERNQVRVEVKLPARLPKVRVDPLQVQQVLLNLILNARDAMAEGGILRVRAARRAGPPAGVTVTISDSGCGITPEQMKRLFAPFYSTKLERGGSGLGLTICRRIMTQHGGRIEVESRPGEGTDFTLWFPLPAGEADNGEGN